MTTNDAAFQQRLDALVAEYLTVGCPCRFPRFRAMVARDTSRVAGGTFTGDDQRGLIAAFDRRAPLVDREALGPWSQPEPQMYAAKCGVCGSRVERSSNEFGPGAWMDYLVIRRAQGLVDLGAPVESGRILRARPLVPVGQAAGMAKAAQMSPLVDEDEWFEWLRARANPG